MERRRQALRTACAATLMLAGAGGLVALATTFSVLGHMEKEAMETPRDPPAAHCAETPVQTTEEADGQGGVNWGYWREVNDDIVAWLHIPGTGIDHPVAQAPENDPGFYLSHDVFGNWNPCGCLYIDAGCAEGPDSRNVIVYGHNLGDLSMFGELVGYLDTDWASRHQDVELITPSETMRLEVAGADKVNGATERKRTAFVDDWDYNRYVQDRLSRCDMALKGGVGHVGRMCTLCTCSYFTTPENERTLVYALG